MRADRRQFLGIVGGALAALGLGGKAAGEAKRYDHFSRDTSDRGSYISSFGHQLHRVIPYCAEDCVRTTGIHATSNGGSRRCLTIRGDKRRFVYFVPGDANGD